MKLSFGYTLLMVAFAAAAVAAPAAPATFDGSSASDVQSSPAVGSSPASEPTPTSTVQTATANSIPGSSSVDPPSATSSVDPTTDASSSLVESTQSATPSDSSTATSSVGPGTSTSAVGASTSSPDAPASTATTETITDGSTTASATSSPSATSTSVEVTSSAESPSTTTGSQATSTDATSSVSSVTSQPTSAPISVDRQVYLDAHNDVRAQFGASPLTWSDDLQAKAQAYADQCQLKHSDGALGPVGENLAAATGSFSERQAVALFTQDRDQFNKRNVVMSHFTQVVWKSTTQLGCGIASCPGLFGDRRGTATYHVCLYDPVGNVVGEENDNLPIN